MALAQSHSGSITPPDPNEAGPRRGRPRLTPVPDLDGFRSARFGMDAAAVADAIRRDFGLSAERLEDALMVIAPDPFPAGGSARITYRLSAGRLDSVELQWPAIPGAINDDLDETATLLRDHLVSYGSGRAGLVVDQLSADKSRYVLLIDRQERVAALVLTRGSDGAAEELTLTYAARAAERDNSAVPKN